MAESKKDKTKPKNIPELLSLDAALLPNVAPVMVPIVSINRTQPNHEGVIFVWFDSFENPSVNFHGPLRAINDNVQSFHDKSSCVKMIQSSNEKIFFLTTSTNSDFISRIHKINIVEFIFIYSPNVESIKGDFPKLVGIFNRQEDLFRVLKEVFDTFEQIQFELFEFEEEKGFLCSQLWKETLNQKPRKKNVFIECVRQYYRDNPLVLRLIDDFDKTYRASEVINWCLRSPFPSRFFLHALRSHNKEQLKVCRPIFIDVAHFFHQHPKPKTNNQFYRGMKLSNEILDQFEAHVNRLVCVNGFFPCTKSRTNAITLASLPTYRLDLAPVFFKISCDPTSLYVEITDKYPSPLIAFDVNTPFFIVYVKRGPMTVIKMRTATELAWKLVSEYIEQHKNQSIQSLIDQLTKPPTPPPKPPTPPPPPPKPPTPAMPPAADQVATAVKQSKDSNLTTDEIRAQSYVRRGEIDRALAIYRRVEPMTPRILNAIAQLSSEKKGDHQYAIKCYTEALKMLDENSEDYAETLTDLANTYQNCEGYDLAIGNHTRALAIRQSQSAPDDAAIASNFIGIANAHWARSEYTQALDHAQRALLLRENLNPLNEASLAATYAMLSNIYQDSGNSELAIELSKKALTMFQRVLSLDSPILAELFYNLANMQLSINSIDEACQSYERSVKIYRKCLPQGHPDRVTAENEYQRVLQLNESNKTKEQK